MLSGQDFWSLASSTCMFHRRHPRRSSNQWPRPVHQCQEAVGARGSFPQEYFAERIVEQNVDVSTPIAIVNVVQFSPPESVQNRMEKQIDDVPVHPLQEAAAEVTRGLPQERMSGGFVI